MVTLADWRAQVDKELAGKSFEKALVHQTPEGIVVAPLYTTLPHELMQTASSMPFRICMRDARDLDEGADALWVPLEKADVNAFVVIDAPNGARADQLPRRAFALCAPVSPEIAKWVLANSPGSTSTVISTLVHHEAGAPSVDEVACALSLGARALKTLLEAGLTAEQAAGQIGFQISVGRDTFLELCKLRALRLAWAKVLTAVGVKEIPRTLVHAVCSMQTMTVRDPWVNMLRVTTQVFSAVLGGADLVTPNAFDQATGAVSDHGRRVARNTGLVLREESHLGKVSDPAAGAYAFETLTDELARKAWQRFREFEKTGLPSFEAAWSQRLEAIAKRKLPILGVSDFANLDEPSQGLSTGRRDAAQFEALRDRTEQAKSGPVALVTLGTFAESRARVGFAQNFFAAGGLRSSETNERAKIACLCGTDERYATEAVARVKALKAAGVERVLLAGRPGALEAPLREAGVDAFIFVGCDVIATLLEVTS